MSGMPLSSFSQGEKGHIENINGGRNLSKRLYEMGFNKGTEIRVVKNDVGPLIVSLYGGKIAIGRGMAQKIFVRTENYS